MNAGEYTANSNEVRWYRKGLPEMAGTRRGMRSGRIYPKGISGSLSIIGTDSRVSQPE